MFLFCGWHYSLGFTWLWDVFVFVCVCVYLPLTWLNPRSDDAIANEIRIYFISCRYWHEYRVNFVIASEVMYLVLPGDREHSTYILHIRIATLIFTVRKLDVTFPVPKTTPARENWGVIFNLCVDPVAVQLHSNRVFRCQLMYLQFLQQFLCPSYILMTWNNLCSWQNIAPQLQSCCISTPTYTFMAWRRMTTFYIILHSKHW